jgi:hypothetical protein
MVRSPDSALKSPIRIASPHRSDTEQHQQQPGKVPPPGSDLLTTMTVAKNPYPDSGKLYSISQRNFRSFKELKILLLILLESETRKSIHNLPAGVKVRDLELFNMAQDAAREFLIG